MADPNITEDDLHRRRLAVCVRDWPECESGGYDPRCCRFPKSCSPHGYIEAVRAGYLTAADLEPERQHNQHKRERPVTADHDPLCEQSLGEYVCICGDLRERDANTRTDERKRANVESWISWRAEIVADTAEAIAQALETERESGYFQAAYGALGYMAMERAARKSREFKA